MSIQIANFLFWVINISFKNSVTVKSSVMLFYSHGEDVQSIHRAPHHLEVVLEDGDGAGQGLMSAAAEQSHTRVQQDGGYKRRVRDPAQAFDAALEAS